MGNGSSNETSRQQMFERISNKLQSVDPALARALGGVFLFAVINKQSVTHWTMDLNTMRAYLGEPPEEEEADATFTLTEETLHQVAEGRITARAAVQAGRCSVTGDIVRAMKLEPYIKL